MVVKTKPEQPKPEALNLRRTPKPEKDIPPPPRDKKVSEGPIEKVTEFLFNPTRDKIREVTYIDAFQAREFPKMDMLNTLRRYVLEIATYRENSSNYFKLFKVAP